MADEAVGDLFFKKGCFSIENSPFRSGPPDRKGPGCAGTPGPVPRVQQPQPLLQPLLLQPQPQLFPPQPPQQHRMMINRMNHRQPPPPQPLLQHPIMSTS